MSNQALTSSTDVKSAEMDDTEAAESQPQQDVDETSKQKSIASDKTADDAATDKASAGGGQQQDDGEDIAGIPQVDDQAPQGAGPETQQVVASPETPIAGPESDVTQPIQPDDKAQPKTKQATNAQTKEKEEDEELLYGAAHVIMLFAPVSVCLAFVIATISSVKVYREKPVAYLVYTPFHEESERYEDKLWESLANAAIFLSIMVGMTVIMFLLYKFKCYKFLHGWIMLSSLVMLIFFTFNYLDSLFREYNVPFDYVTLGILLWNFAGLGMLTIFWKGPLILQQAYLILTSALLALVFIKFLPEWTVWTILAIISVWDLIAVLCPKGPLRLLVELAQERNEPILPGLIYSSTMAVPIITMADGEECIDESAKNGKLMNKKNRIASSDTEEAGDAVPEERRVRIQEDEDEEPQERGVKLGLGDFIFYSVLVGKASSYGDWNTTIACFVSILIGLCCTLLLLAIHRKALPALPISIMFGIVFYFCTSVIIQPFVVACSGSQVYL